MRREVFARRRRELMDRIGDGCIAVLAAAPVLYRNRDVEYPYRPDSDFYYLTGFAEPEAVAVLIPERPQGEYLLFCRERDAAKESLHGPRAGLEGACELYGADDAFPIEDIDDILPGLLESGQRLYYALGQHPDFDRQVLDWLNRSRDSGNAPQELVSLESVLHELRLCKAPEEIVAMRRAVDITVGAHLRVMELCRPGLWEYQIQAELYYEFMRQGARQPAYPAIIGSGPRSCIAHYTDNSGQLGDGDVLLLDAGAECDYYAADVARTLPVNGRYSPRQRALYDLVLAAQQAALATLRPGQPCSAPHQAALRTLLQGLVDLGLLQGGIDGLIEQKAWQRFHIHRSSHWLGMDVHDVGDYKIGNQWRLLEPGMTLTIEPGLAIPAGTPDVPEVWWNQGIRIEDDVLITPQGHEVLSAALPSQASEIEAIMGK
jgi:Xaa-Pro aminopeptidase